MAKEYIERETLISRINGMGYHEQIKNNLLFIARMIPAADVAPVRRGRWLEEDGIQICSECGEEHEWEDYRAPYCDTCGAKMDKEKA